MDSFFNILLAVGIPLFIYVFIAYANRRFKQMDQAMEERDGAVSLTTSELKALVHEAVEESVADLLARTEDAEQRLAAMERRLEPPSEQPLLQLPGAAEEEPVAAPLRSARRRTT